MNLIFEEDDESIVMKNEAGEKLGEIAFSGDGDYFTVFHTGVNPDYRGQHLGDKLVLQTIEKAKREQRKIIPTCPFARKYFLEHPEYQEFVQGDLN
ncbi:GNAT family N-acetyltransferase [Lactococcus nasutitermitis]|uniref:GNAT family N-acetyltransferase n=1 Tax=Lactococcus nasutitermitis TaxID=1652957 RepID=A0ABV9JD39_9LACT|nr:GNAT family N-acetyltransferase [Lactococcus nasutitermitis]